MKTYNLTLEEAVGSEMAEKVRTARGLTLIGVDHADELEIVEPDYSWVRVGIQWDGILEAITEEIRTLEGDI